MPSFERDWEWLFRQVNQLVTRGSLCAEIRAILVCSATGWQNYATCLHISALPENECPQQHVFGSLALLRKQIRLSLISSESALIHAVTTWETVRYAVELGEPLAAFHTCFFGSQNRYGEHPVWMFQFGDRVDQGQTHAPSDPLLDLQVPLYKTVAEAAADWLSDPSIRQNYRPSCQYQCLLTSSRTVIEDVNAEKDGKLEVKIKALDSLSELFLKLSEVAENDIPVGQLQARVHSCPIYQPDRDARIVSWLQAA